MKQIDKEYWSRIEKLTRTELDAALGRWVEAEEIAAILDRRERMKAEIKKLASQAASR
jgi:hypothetical protein